MTHKTSRDSAALRESGTQAIKEMGILYHSKDDGAHLVLYFSWYTIDYWPSSRKWHDARRQRRGQGIREMLKHMGLPPDYKAEMW